MNKREILAGAIILLAVGVLVWVLQGKFSEPKQAAGRIVTVLEGPIEDAVEAMGSVAPLNRVEIKPPISGRMEKLLAEEGDEVKAGQILAWMSSSDRAAILDAARAKGAEELKRWQEAYKPTPIVAPLSGVVILRDVVVGQTVGAGDVLFAMADSLIVVAQVDESDIGRIHVGMPTRITLDAYPDRLMPGKVFDILYEGKNVSNVIQYGVKVRPLEVPSYYRSQMTANVSFIVNQKDRTLLVPAQAVREARNGTKQVLLRGSDGKSAVREVKTGVENGDNVEVLSGLKAGDQILLIQRRYVPQQAPQSSPLTFGSGRRPAEDSGQAPRPRRGGNGSN